MEDAINKKNDWDMTKANMRKGPNEKVAQEEMVIAMKSGKAVGPSEVCAEMTSAIGKVGISVMIKLY